MSSDVEAECSLLRQWLGQALDKEAIREMSAALMTEKVHQHFDAQKLDDDAAAQSELPAWLGSMCADAKWRALLYELCVAHPQCELLKSTVRSLSQGETASEVQGNARLCAVIGGGSSLQTFVANLEAQLKALRAGQPGAQATLNGMACSGEVEYFTSQLLLRAQPLAGSDHAALMEQASGAMAEAAASMHGSAARRLQLLAAGVPRNSALMSAMVSILTAVRPRLLTPMRTPMRTLMRTPRALWYLPPRLALPLPSASHGRPRIDTADRPRALRRARSPQATRRLSWSSASNRTRRLGRCSSRRRCASYYRRSSTQLALPSRLRVSTCSPSSRASVPLPPLLLLLAGRARVRVAVRGTVRVAVLRATVRRGVRASLRRFERHRAFVSATR